MRNIQADSFGWSACECVPFACGYIETMEICLLDSDFRVDQMVFSANLSKWWTTEWYDFVAMFDVNWNEIANEIDSTIYLCYVRYLA